MTGSGENIPHLIVGLGNPGTEYQGSRHNIGFELIARLAAAHRIKIDQRADRARIGRGQIAGISVILARPQTFYNDSGSAVAALMRRYQIPASRLLVILDDLRLPPGKLRLRAKGSHGGNNGIKSIAAQLDSTEWARLRIGVGEPPPGLQVDWVLSPPSRAERPLLDDALLLAMGAVEVWLHSGIEAAMNRFNADPPPAGA